MKLNDPLLLATQVNGRWEVQEDTYKGNIPQGYQVVTAQQAQQRIQENIDNLTAEAKGPRGLGGGSQANYNAIMGEIPGQQERLKKYQNYTAPVATDQYTIGPNGNLMLKSVAENFMPSAQEATKGVKPTMSGDFVTLSNGAVVPKGSAADIHRDGIPTSQTIEQGIQNLPLTPEQQKAYFASQGNAANPLSPSAWLAQQQKGGASAVAGVSSSTLQAGTKVGTPASTYTTNTADATVAGADASLKSINDYITMLTPPKTETSKTVDDLISQITGKMDSLEGRGASQLEEEQAQGVAQKKQTLQNYQTELQVKTAEYKSIQAKYAALNADLEGKAITMNSIVGSQAQVNRAMQAELNTKAAEIAMIQANVAGAQGNLDLAQSAADRAVDLKYSDAKDAIELRLQQVELFQGKLTKEEQIRNDAVSLYLEDQKTKLATQVANEKDKNATLLNQMQSYPDAGISLNDTIETANTKITTKSAIYKKAKATGGGSDGTIPLTATDRQALLGAGFSQSEVASIENDVNQYGINSVLEGITDPKQKAAIQKTYGGTPEETPFITKEFLKTQFANTTIDSMLKTMGKTRDDYAKFWQPKGSEEQNIKDDFGTYVDNLMPVIEQYRTAGYTDKEILNLMK